MVGLDQNPAEPSSVDDLLAAVAAKQNGEPESEEGDPELALAISDDVAEGDVPTEDPIPIPAGYTLVRYSKGGWLGFLFEGERYSVGTQPSALPDSVAIHAMRMYHGQIVSG